MWVILSGKCISGDDDVTLYVILLGRCISTNLVQRESSVQTEDCCDEDTDDHQQWYSLFQDLLKLRYS